MKRKTQTHHANSEGFPVRPARLHFLTNVLQWSSGSTAMLQTYTAKYTRLGEGYMGQMIEWPEVVTEGHDLEECRAMLRDALREMVRTYRDLGREIPIGNALLEQLPNELCKQAGLAPKY